MPVAEVRAYLDRFGLGERISEFDISSATVPLAAMAVGVEEAAVESSPYVCTKTSQSRVLLISATGRPVPSAGSMSIRTTPLAPIPPGALISMMVRFTPVSIQAVTPRWRGSLPRRK